MKFHFQFRYYPIGNVRIEGHEKSFFCEWNLFFGEQKSGSYQPREK